MKKQVWIGEKKPGAPLAPAIIAGDFVFVSGQGPLDAENNVVGASIEEQTKVTLENLFAVLKAAGAEPNDIVKIQIYLDDIKRFAGFNESFTKVMPAEKPARTTVGTGLIRGMMIEIDCVAYIGGK